jgi:hypothetical protein
VQILATIEQLEHNALHRAGRNGVACWLRMVMYDLQEVMLRVLEDHENTFVFQNNLDKLDYIGVTKL